MEKEEYLKITAALRRGESLNLSPEQAAGLVTFQALEHVAAGVEAAQREPQPIQADALSRILTVYGGNFGVWRLFTEIVRKCQITPAAFASGLAAAYTTGRADRETALLLFKFARPSDMMNPDEMAIFDGLPDRLTIYRGCSTEEIAGGVFGLSWTLSRDVAEFFAWRYGAPDTSRVVVRTEITRAQALAYFSATTGEREIITDVTAGPSQPVEIIAREPSARFWEYMRGSRWNDRPENTAAV